jgi:hypothetical protein
VPSFEKIGFPVVEARADGSFVVTKHPGTGGLVSVATVSEQLLLRDGSADLPVAGLHRLFRHHPAFQKGPGRVQVSGDHWSGALEKLKVTVSFSDGYRAFGRLIVSGPEELRKAEKAAEIFWAAAGGREAYDETSTQFVG